MSLSPQSQATLQHHLTRSRCRSVIHEIKLRFPNLATHQELFEIAEIIYQEFSPEQPATWPCQQLQTTNNQARESSGQQSTTEE